MTIWIMLKLIFITFAMQLLPGWAIISLGGFYKRWSTLQRWILAFFVGMAFYPVFFYLASALLPGMQIGSNKLIVFLVLCLLFNFWQYRKSWKDNFKFEKRDFIVLGLLLITILTRMIPTWQYPYPAWSDSLHHSIITKLVMLNGQLPADMLPFDPTNLSAYHLGLYALSGSLGLLGNVAPHTALLVYSQLVNAFAGLAVFVFLDKRMSRTAGLAGMVFAGLVSFQPALYFNWGRFPQMASQTMLLPAALLAWEAFESGTQTNNAIKSPTGTEQGQPFWKRFDIIAISIAGLTISACALLHFRVAAFLLPLLVFIFIFTIGKIEVKKAQAKQIFFNTLLVALVALILTLPALVTALSFYLNPIWTPEKSVNPLDEASRQKSLAELPYYTFKYETFFEIGLTRAASIFAALGLLIGLCFKKTKVLAMTTIAWLASLFIEGSLAKFNIYKLAFVNMTGVMILAYMPGALGFGLLFEELKKAAQALFGINKFTKSGIQAILTWMLVFIGLLFTNDRINQIEPWRHFMSVEDEQAMLWIKENTPKDAVFAVNTFSWAGGAVHGTDAGHWIPYFAERETNTRTMISVEAYDYNIVQYRSKLVYSLYLAGNELIDTQPFCNLNVDYLYSAKNAPFNNQDFNLLALLASPNVELIYDENGVQILQLCSNKMDLVLLDETR